MGFPLVDSDGCGLDAGPFEKIAGGVPRTAN
jgi:hypothetical protein